MWGAAYHDLPASGRATAVALHPGLLKMARGPEDFVAIEAGHGAKSDMCRRIAARLGVDLASLAFIDDSRYERAEVREHAPEVRVLVGEPSDWRRTLLHGPGLARWEVTDTHAQRWPDVEVQRVALPRNGVTRGLVERARCGGAAWSIVEE